MASSSPSKASRRATKRASEIKQGKQREFDDDNAVEVAADEPAQEQLQQAEGGSVATENNGKMWPYIRLSESTGATRGLPAVFSKDGRFCFVGSGASVKIYSVKTCQLLSSLNLPDVPSLPAKKGHSSSNTVTGVFLNPSNPLQLLTTSLDGLVRIWDYLDGRVLRTIDMGGPVSLACVSHNDGTETNGTDSLYVGVLKQSERSSGLNTIVYQINLNKREHPKKRLGKCKGASLMQVSNDGRHLVILGKRKIHIAILSDSTKEGSFVSFDGFPLYWEDRHSTNDVFTALSIHPTESYFATGDSKGVIRFWYILNPTTLSTLQKTVGTPENKSKSVLSLLPRKATSMLHWHAHGVSTLQFTPNGAYLLSGGEEAVLVVWQCQSKHKEFVPRLGGPISTVSITVSEGREQEFAIRLKDGSISFVGAGTLKVVRSIAGVKSLSDSQYISSASSLPLAVEPYTSHLVFQASYPSSIQFFSPSLQAHLHELDVSPGNRVSRTDERALEPIRVEKVAFAPVSSTSATMSGKVWMATFDTWQDRGYSRESHLKFWIGEPGLNDGRRYVLNTRIDQPHGQERLTALAYSASAAAGAAQQPRLATCSLDGSIKVWSNRPVANGPSEGIWQCSLSLSYRSLQAHHLAFSHDGSLLAVAHCGTVTLWNTASGKMVKALVLPGGQSTAHGGKVAFVGKDGSRLVAAGRKGTTVWDVLTCEELLTLPEPAEHLISDVASDAYTSTFGDKAHTHSLADESKIDLSDLVFPLHEAAGYPTSSSSAQSAQTLAGISKKGEVILTGPNIASSDSSSATEAQNLRALARTYASSDRPIRLFDEIFGASKLQEMPEVGRNSSSLPFVSLEAAKNAGTDIFAETPSHRLPSIASLAGSILAQSLKPLPSTTGQNAKASSSRMVNGTGKARQEAESDSDDEVASRKKPAAAAAKQADMEIDEPMVSTQTAGPPAISYIDSPAGLVDVFKKTLALAQPSINGTAGPGTPLGGKKDPRIAGIKDSDRKALKKKKSLSSMFGGGKGTPSR